MSSFMTAPETPPLDSNPPSQASTRIGSESAKYQDSVDQPASQSWFSTLLSSFAVRRRRVPDDEIEPLISSSEGSSFSDDGYGGTVIDGADATTCSAPDESLAHRTSLGQEFKILVHFAWPVIVSSTLGQALNMTSLVSVGHIGTVELGAVSRML